MGESRQVQRGKIRIESGRTGEHFPSMETEEEGTAVRGEVRKIGMESCGEATVAEIVPAAFSDCSLTCHVDSLLRAKENGVIVFYKVLIIPWPHTGTFKDQR